MSEQVQFLGNLINSAQAGNDGAVKMLREICEIAMTRAPSGDLLRIARCLYEIGIEASGDGAGTY